MSQAKHADILQNLLAVLGAIATTGGYNLNVVRVLDRKPLPARLDPLPLAAVIAGADKSRALPCNLLEHTAAFEIAGYVDVPFGTETATRAGLLLADLQRAVLADPSRGGAAIDTLISKSRCTPDKNDGIAAVSLNITVRYHEPV